MTPQPSVRSFDDVAAQFVVHRPKLYAIAYRTLGSAWSADDAVQEVWLRLQRTDVAAVRNLEAWLTTVVSRVCIDLIRQRATWREDLAGDDVPETGSVDDAPAGRDPAATAMRSEDLALAIQVLLDTLGPLERLALVLHDVFALSYDEIAPIVERTPSTARQLASRARARLRAVDVDTVRERQQEAIDAFLAAARNGDFGGLLQLLDPEIELRSDETAVALASAGADYGAPLLDHRVRGVDAVARVFAGRAELTRLVYIDGVPAAAYIADGVVRAVYLIRFDNNNKIARMDVLADGEHLANLAVAG
ncbi:sigma-70 family RNA polymerase sigma factor [Phytoactinopolyspora limicola]|uniref:sigma-70 family RNA polymerase sigma factor n=1 Tax=Phytoactinopolyspora limicola TaxID=2715536 RepID=UPI00140C0CF6|nr:sigma-70 family RNA polymerase sigma factor [Phytoactinopolyspora limicola]